MLHRNRVWMCLAVFLLAFGVRFSLIATTPKYDNSIDLEIYRAGGGLIAKGVNPYDYAAGLVEREALRSRTTQATLKDPALWNYYASSNLPLTLLFFGGITSIHDSALAYRYTFAVLDSFLSLFVFLFVLDHWTSQSLVGQRDSTLSRFSGAAFGFYGRLLMGLGLSALSPTLLKWGTIFPEDKGIQTLLMVFALACILSSNRRIAAYGAPVVVGLSIAYKGLGIFLLPLFIARLLSHNPRSLRRIASSISLCIMASCIWFLPFGVSLVLQMGRGRLLGNSVRLPQHASIWVWVARYMPDHWNIVRIGFMAALLCVACVGYARRRFGLGVVTSVAMVAFVVVWLTGGSMDRVNIGVMISILLLGRHSVRAALPALIIYFSMGAAGMFSRGEDLESIGLLLWAITFAMVVARSAFRRQPTAPSLGWAGDRP
ncbi:MAG: hypothetical protein ABSC23_02455 [Bryobacteraceae bacterium]|jgi:hypothetical protein